MVASGETRKATSAVQRHTSHTSVIATCTRNNVKKLKKKLCACSAHFYKVHRQLTPAWPVSKEALMLPLLTGSCSLISISIHLKLHLLLLSLSFLRYILLISNVHVYLSTFRSLGGLCFSSMVNTELCSPPLRIPRQAWHQLINQNSVVAFSQIAITQYITYGFLSSDLLRT